MPSTITDRLFGLTTSVAVKAPCRVATTANITLSGEQTIDGVAVVAGDRVLVKDQTTGSENGIYVAATNAWTRAADFDGSLDVVKGTLVSVHSGSTNSSTFWRITTADTITIGTTSITFAAFVVAADDLSVVTSRTILAALPATADATAWLAEEGREGMFVFETTDLSAKVTLDTLQGIYVAPSSDTDGSSGAWVRKYDGAINLKWFGAVGGVDIAPMVRSINAMARPYAVDVYLPGDPTPYLWNSKVDLDVGLYLHSSIATAQPNQPILFGAKIIVASGVTALVPQRGLTSYADYAKFSGISFAAAGKDTTTTTGDMTNADGTLTITGGNETDFSDGQIVRIRGAGPPGIMHGGYLTGATTNGSPVITCNQSHAAIAGMVLMVAGAGFPAGTTVLSYTLTTITMSANATATVSGAAISYYADLHGYIMSGGGTTTVELNVLSFRNVTNAKVEHYDSAIFAFTNISIDNCSASGFQGCCFAICAGSRYANPEEAASINGTPNANMFVWNNVVGRGSTNGILIDGGDTNASVVTMANCFSNTEFCIIDQTQLGMHWNGCHVSGERGIMHVIEGASFSLFSFPYTESGTINTFASSAGGLGLQPSLREGGSREVSEGNKNFKGPTYVDTLFVGGGTQRTNPTNVALYKQMSRAAAVANLTTTASSGSLPVANGTVTIADAAAPTVTELLEYCVELEAKLEAKLAADRTAGLMET